jgi:protein tyrosine phosphatase (PTP) superfamily phosphohydrolase (DUF442 family)
MFTLFITVLSNFDVFEPYLAPLLHMALAPVRIIDERIMIGPYPPIHMMVSLKRKGIEVIISLLDTSLPQERALAEKESINARRTGIEFRQFPMGYIPVESAKNKQMRERVIRSIAGDRKKTYIHCYLGRHRVRFVAEGYLSAQGGAVKTEH